MKEEFDLFIEHCAWAYECWKMNQLFCEYKIEDPTGIWARFGIIVREYGFSQIAKIHDPDEYQGKKRLSLKYIVTHCVNTDSYRDSYDKFCQDNTEFIQAVKAVRNKITSHSDLTAYKSDKEIGAFSAGKDKQYFDNLHEIISKGYIELGFEPFPEWPDFIENDVKQFMNKFIKVFNT